VRVWWINTTGDAFVCNVCEEVGDGEDSNIQENMEWCVSRQMMMMIIGVLQPLLFTW